MARVLLIGLKHHLASVIGSTLEDAGHYVSRGDFKSCFPVWPDADVILLWCDDHRYLQTLAALRSRPQAPPVVATSFSENTGWIDSLEAGVSGYCVAPVHREHILHALETALKGQRPIGTTATVAA